MRDEKELELRFDVSSHVSYTEDAFRHDVRVAFWVNGAMTISVILSSQAAHELGERLIEATDRRSA